MHVVTAWDKHNHDVVILAVFTDQSLASKYCDRCRGSDRYLDARVHHPRELDEFAERMRTS